MTTPADFVSDGTGILQPEQPQNPSEFAQVFKQSEQYQKILSVIDEHRPPSAQPVKVVRIYNYFIFNGNVSDYFFRMQKKKRIQPDYVNPFWRQTYLCTWRAWKIASRDRMALYSRFITTFIMGFYFGVSFLFSDNTQIGAENRQNMLFISSMYTLFSTMITLEDLYNQRAVFNEQRDARKWYCIFIIIIYFCFVLPTRYRYKTLPYFIAYSSTEVVLGLLQCVLLCVEMYWLTGLGNGEGKFKYFRLICLVTVLIT